MYDVVILIIIYHQHLNNNKEDPRFSDVYLGTDKIKIKEGIVDLFSICISNGLLT